jgi:lipopolysaccharide transport system ATP-binding protein
MPEPIIQANNISKIYRIGAREHLNRTFREVLINTLSSPFKNLRDLRKLTHFKDVERKSKTAPSLEPDDFIWALKDVSFKIYPGEVVGIIGRNGAGKSTLLKILSQITEPSSGEIILHGRISSLLEVGTGFHPELTGRENIYLNGTILGMRKYEIDRRFDEIVAFSEIEKFLDTPVKRYSSGMYVRLAFAIAAHLEPEILLVDEVLAVGDVAFQKKCLGKMGSISSEGRTVLFVSHNMPTIKYLCQRVILFKEGSIAKDGQTDSVIENYISEDIDLASAQVDLSCHLRRAKHREAALKRVWLTNQHGQITNSFSMGDTLTISYSFQGNRRIINPGFGFGFEDEYGQRIFSLNNYFIPNNKNTFDAIDNGTASFKVPNLPLLPGTYFISISLVENQIEWVDSIDQAISFNVLPSDIYGSGKIPERGQGIINIPGEIIVSST